MKTVLFLDFDGVTHPEPCFDAQAFCCLHLIEAVLRDHPGVEVVISSSWRDHHPLDELRGFFSADIGLRVVGVTPSIKVPDSSWLPGQVSKFERQWECESWLRQHRPGAPWVAIDDRPYWFEPNCSNLLVTARDVGFRLDHAAELDRMLKERA